MFEDQYIALRKKEGRFYSDQELLNLPAVAPNHQHYNEWKIRRDSTERLIGFLKRKQQPLNILEVGCGNGWLSHQLAQIPQSNVTGTDVNAEELAQAERVFSEQQNLRFINGDIRQDVLGERSFDIIVFAASIQYFFPLNETLNVALKHLATGGEIHIIDSYFYPEGNVYKARQRTKEYYDSMGFPQMSDFYFHHTNESLAGFNYWVMNKFSMLYAKLLKRSRVLPWIMLKNAKSE